MQEHHPMCSPLKEDNGHECDVPYKHRRYSFRLIYFGRSVEDKPENQLTRAHEENFGKKLFGLL